MAAKKIKKRLKVLGVSAFQMKVYVAVASIPRGEVRSYKWVARKIGKPLAFRAVGHALNKNPLPGIVPCHRVVRSNGELGGFARGVRLKKRLLEREKTIW